MPDYGTLATAAREAVSLASAVCREVQRSLEEVRAITKDDKSPVTVADFASQAIVAKVLADRLGAVVLVGEEDSKWLREDGHGPHRAAALAAVQTVWEGATEEEMLDAIDVGSGDTHHAGFWTLDPVDGTKGFLRNQQYAIALAYIERGTPVVGVLGCPNLPRNFSAPLDRPDRHGCIYSAIRGSGVFEYVADDPGEKPVEIKRLDHAEGEPISVCASVEAAHSNVDDTDNILQYLTTRGHPTGEPARLDSQAKYAVTARGQADAYLRLPTKKGYVERIWDHAAGTLVAAEAGCFVTDIGGHPLDFSHGRGLEKNKGVVCGPPRVHGLVIGAIEALGIGKA
ncbi:MAG TPA: 3'(2'),5'-bisphosphate nucleotidase [Phycisphaerales bacterium]|nr:3'(2'),5'-bisphosphate nucleotidase [Phycisphaerales bacterium]